MPFADRASQAESVKRYLHHGGNMLIVGARSTNFPETVRSHPRVRVWDTTDPSTENKDIPENTRVILCTRFVRHGMFARLHKYAAKKQILMVPGLGNTGEIKDVVRTALNIPVEFTDPSPVAAPDVPETPMQTAEAEIPVADAAPAETEPIATPHKRGALKEFIQQHLDMKGAPAAEARRILPLAAAAGFTTTTHAAIAQTIYLLRNPNPAGLRAVRPEPASVTPAPSNISEALRLLDDAMVMLNLVREAVIKVKSDDESTQETLRKLRGFLEGAPAAATRA